MNPELESFLEDAFSGIEPASQDVGRVVVEPDYEASITELDKQTLVAQLTEFLQHNTPAHPRFESDESIDAQVGGEYPLLQKYVRRVSFHPDRADGPWVEVEPPGNWI